MRDDFLPSVKELLAKRVGYRCSNPDCRQPTSGPQVDPTKTVNVGVASHITAASPDGPRYDSMLTPEERKSPDNGIWLCQKCGKLVDNDAIRYPVTKLREWKNYAEETAIRELEGVYFTVPSGGAAGPAADLGDQMAALAGAFLEDLWRTKPQVPNYGDEIQALIDSTWKRVQELRRTHPSFLGLPEEIRRGFECLLRSLHELRNRKDDGVWYAGFTVRGQIAQLAELIRKIR